MLALTVSGCFETVLTNKAKPVANEQKIVDIMYKFFHAISAENFGRAKIFVLKIQKFTIFSQKYKPFLKTLIFHIIGIGILTLSLLI